MNSSHFYGSATTLVVIGHGALGLSLLGSGAEVLSSSEKMRLQFKIDKIAEMLKIHKPLNFIEKEGFSCIAQAQGCCLLPGKAGIIIDPSFVRHASEGELDFLLAHELSHIKNNDIFWTGVISIVAQSTMTIAIDTLFPASSKSLPFFRFQTYSGLVADLLTVGVMMKYSKICEKRADLLAYSVCPEESKHMIPTFFEKLICHNLYLRNSLPSDSCLGKINRILFSEEGDFNLDVMHPPLRERIRYLSSSTRG